MRAVSAGAVLSRELLWWELLVDASERWGSCMRKSLWGSLPVTVKSNAVRCRQAEATGLLNSCNANWRVSNELCNSFVLNVKKFLVDAHEGLRGTYSMCKGSCTFSGSFSRNVTGNQQMSSCFAKWVSLDAMPADHGWLNNGFLAEQLSKKMQQGCAVTLSSSCPDGVPQEGMNSKDEACRVFNAQSLQKDAFQVLTNQAFTSISKHFASRAHVSGSFGCLHMIHRNSPGQSVTSFGRSLSTSTEKQFEDDAGEQHNSVSTQQQSSLEGQQSSLEVPESKPVGGPSWPNPDNAASYVLMSNIYADGDRWDEVKRINEMRLKARAWKKPGKAYVEIQAKVHEFIVGDRTHQDSTNIYEKLRKIKRHMGHIGYVPYVDLVLENRSYYDPYKPR